MDGKPWEARITCFFCALPRYLSNAAMPTLCVKLPETAVLVRTLAVGLCVRLRSLPHSANLEVILRPCVDAASLIRLLPLPRSRLLDCSMILSLRRSLLPLLTRLPLVLAASPKSLAVADTARHGCCWCCAAGGPPCLARSPTRRAWGTLPTRTPLTASASRSGTSPAHPTVSRGCQGTSSDVA